MPELEACTPVPVDPTGFNASAVLPYGLEPIHLQKAMVDFVEFLGFLNAQLYFKNPPRLESFLMSANFSSIVGEFMAMTIPEYCSALVKNKYHNGHPDLVPAGMYPNDAILHASEGIEIKGSRYKSGWQGHNPEKVWLMVFNFDSNTAADLHKELPPKPFKFLGVYLAKLEMEDWTFSGRSETSRRTITASVNKSGLQKMYDNWLYKDF